MISVFFTILLLTFTFSLFFFSGYIILRVLNYSNKYSLLIAPTLGVAFLTIIAQNFIYLNIQLSYSAWLVLGILVIMFAAHLYVRGGLPSWPKFSFILKQRLFVTSLLVVVISQGFGLFSSTSEDYIGGGTRDQWNYNAMSQFLKDYPFSHINIDHNPYIALPRNVKDDRIGVSVIHSLVSTLSGQNTKTTYGALSLMGPILLVFNLWLLGLKLGFKPLNRFFLVTLGATLPGITYLLITNNNFAHIVGLPFLFLLPILLEDLIIQPRVSKALIVAIVLSGANAIYTDMSLLYLIIAVAMLGLNFMYEKSVRSIRSAFVVAVAFVSALIINPGFMNATTMLFKSRSSVPNIFYPEYALKLEGVYKIWNQLDFASHQTLVNQALLLITIFGFSGLILLFIASKNNLLSFSLLVLAAIPIMLLGADKPYPYQFYKLLISVSPLLVIGLIKIKEELIKTRPSFLLNLIVTVIFLFLIWVASSSTIEIENKAVASTAVYRSDKIKSVFSELEGSRDKNYLIITDNKELGSWLSYHARYNRIYLLKDFYGLGWNMKATYTLPYLSLWDIDNSNIRVINLSSIQVHPQAAEQLVGGTIDNEEFGTSRDYDIEPASLDKQIDISLWAKKEMSVILTFKISGDTIPDKLPISLQLRRAGIDAKEYLPLQKRVKYSLRLVPGVQQINIQNISNKSMILSDFNIVYNQ